MLSIVMPTVAVKPIVLSAVMLNVVMPSAVIPSIVMLTVAIKAIMLSTIMLNVVKLSAVILNIEAPFSINSQHFHKKKLITLPHPRVKINFLSPNALAYCTKE